MHSVRVVLATGLAGAGALANRLVALNPAEADWDQHWRRTGADHEHPVPAGTYAQLTIPHSQRHTSKAQLASAGLTVSHQCAVAQGIEAHDFATGLTYTPITSSGMHRTWRNRTRLCLGSSRLC